MNRDHDENSEPEVTPGTPGEASEAGTAASGTAGEQGKAREADDNDAAETAGEHAGSAVEQDLASLVDDARNQRDEYLDLAQRTQADFDNYRKRMATENRSASRRGRLDVVGDLIEAIDNLERVLTALEIDPVEALEAEIPADAPVAAQGVIVAWRDLHTVLHRSEVEAYAPVGEPFDPNLHEALQAIAAEGTDPGLVIEVMQRGYRSGETVLRPARVVVSQ